MTIIQLLNGIRDREVVLPAIQRDFVWSEDQIKNLLDSILRGYPIGIVLMWETYHAMQYREFEEDYRWGTRPGFKDNPLGRRLKVVLDGQQRLQSLFVALFGTHEGRPACFNVLSGQNQDDTSAQKYVFDFADAGQIQAWNAHARTQMLQSVGEREKDFAPYFGIQVSELFGMSAEAREQFVLGLSQQLGLNQADQLRVRLNLGTLDATLTKNEHILKDLVIDANLPHSSPERESEMDVLEIFVRVNTGGTRLNRSDLIFSMLKLNWKESAEELPELVDRINKGNSFGLNTDFVIRCLFVVSELGARFELDLLRKKSNVQRLQQNFEECCRAIQATIDFVSHQCWIQTSDLIGGSALLVPLVYYFFRLDCHRLPNGEIDRLRRAFFLLAFSRVLSRYGDSRVNKLVGSELKPLADKGDTSFPLEKVADWMQFWGEPFEIGQDLIRRNPALALHLVQGLAGGDVKYCDNLPECDHIFPHATLCAQGVDETRSNHFGNFWILARGKNRNKSDKHPAEYFADVPDSEMQRALIQRDLLEFDRYNEFITKRSARIVEVVQQKIQGVR
jgi:hypothetical protein